MNFLSGEIATPANLSCFPAYELCHVQTRFFSHFAGSPSFGIVKLVPFEYASEPYFEMSEQMSNLETIAWAVNWVQNTVYNASCIMQLPRTWYL